MFTCVPQDHPILLHLNSLHSALAHFQNDAHSSAVKLQHHSLSTSRALESTHRLEYQLSLLQTELDSLRSLSTPTLSPSHPASLQIHQLTLSLRSLSEKLDLAEHTLAQRTHDLTISLSELSRSKASTDAAYHLASRIRAREEASMARERDLELRLRTAEEKAKMSERAVAEYADFVRSLEAKTNSRGVHMNAVVPSQPAAVEISFAQEKNELAAQLSMAQHELAVVQAQLTAERQAHETSNSELSRLRFQLQKLEQDDNTAAKMVSRYMKFSQNSTDALQSTLEQLKARHNATLTTLHDQLYSLSSQLQSSEAINTRLRHALDDLGGEMLKESFGRRREIALRIKLVHREERILEALRRWLRRSEEVLGKPDPVHHLNDMVQDAKIFIDALDDPIQVHDEGIPLATTPVSGSLARLITAQSVLNELVGEVQREQVRRVEAEERLVKLEEAALLPPAPTSSSRETEDDVSRLVLDVETVRISQEGSDAKGAEDAHAADGEETTVGELSVEEPVAGVAQDAESGSDFLCKSKDNMLLDEMDATKTVTPVSELLKAPQSTTQSEGTPSATLEEPAVPVLLVHPPEEPASPLLPTQPIEEPMSPSSPTQLVEAPAVPPSLIRRVQEPVAQPSSTQPVEEPVVPSLFVQPIEEPAVSPSFTQLVEEFAAPSPPTQPVEEPTIPPPLVLPLKETPLQTPASSFLRELEKARKRYEPLQRAFHDCHVALESLKSSLVKPLPPPPQSTASNSLNSLSFPSINGDGAVNFHIPHNILKAVLDRLDDFTEDARVELEIRVSDEEVLGKGYEVLLSVPGAVLSCTEVSDDDGVPVKDEVEAQVRAFVEGTEPGIAKAKKGLEKKLEELQHDIAMLKRAVYDPIGLDVDSGGGGGSSRHGEDSSAGDEGATTPSFSGWTSWISTRSSSGSLSSSSRSASPAPTFGSVMTSRGLKSSASSSSLLSPSVPGFVRRATAGQDSGAEDWVARLGLKIPMPNFGPSLAPREQRHMLGAGSQRPRTVSAMYMLGMGMSGSATRAAVGSGSPPGRFSPTSGESVPQRRVVSAAPRIGIDVKSVGMDGGEEDVD